MTSIATHKLLSAIESKVGASPIRAGFDQASLARLHESLKKLEEGKRRRAHGAVGRASRRVQLAVRADVNRIFKGRRVGNAVRRLVFDNKEHGSAAIVFSKFGRRVGGEFVDYLAPYLTGKDIRPKRGRYLAIPLQRGRRNRDPRQVKGKLRPVRIGSRLFLVKTTRAKTLFMFLLLPRVKIRKRLRTRSIVKAELGRMITDFRG
jgi:hypothetical protein